MPYFIADDCVDVMDRSCIEECPVDCIYEGGRKLYIQPDECIDCGACLPVCPVEAIGVVRYADGDRVDMAADNRAFFELPLPGRDEALGIPGGGATVNPVGVDTPRVTALEPKEDR
jgi:NAD-dependent dihydropyrimidine dehydrogenase PreA subunit